VTGPDHEASDPERGTLTAFLAALCFSLFALVGLAVDGGRAVAARVTASSVAEQAARVGAGQLSVADLRVGRIDISPIAATRVAEAYLRSEGYAGSVTATVSEVTVRVTATTPTVILGIVGIDHIRIDVIGRAIDVHGVTRED
jgi:Flp pilus assembly protein TadG